MEKYYEKKKNDAELMRNVIINAYINGNRKKNTPLIPLFEEKVEKTEQEILDERKELFGNNPLA